MSDPINGEPSSFHYPIWQWRILVWVFLLPLGILMWLLPFSIFLSAIFADFPTAAKILLACGFLGIPGYLVGYIFFYNVMEGVFTRVIFSRNQIAFRTPSVIFPLWMVTKRIPVESIRKIRIGLSPGIGRDAIQVDYQTNAENKSRRLRLPRFPDRLYLQRIRTLEARIEQLPSAPVAGSSTLGGEGPDAISSEAIRQLNEKIRRAGAHRSFRPGPGEQFISILLGLSILAYFVICCWIATSIPGIGKVDALSLGLAVGFTCFWMALPGLYPVLGQLAIWFLGRPLIGAVFWLYQTPNAVWDTPPEANRLLAMFRLSPIHSTLSEFIFWGVLFLSILISANAIRGSLRRREIKKYMEGMGEVNKGGP
jgi:hypothetical protein